MYCGLSRGLTSIKVSSLPDKLSTSIPDRIWSKNLNEILVYDEIIFPNTKKIFHCSLGCTEKTFLFIQNFMLMKCCLYGPTYTFRSTEWDLFFLLIFSVFCNEVSFFLIWSKLKNLNSDSTLILVMIGTDDARNAKIARIRSPSLHLSDFKKFSLFCIRDVFIYLLLNYKYFIHSRAVLCNQKSFGRVYHFHKVCFILCFFFTPYKILISQSQWKFNNPNKLASFVRR